MSVIKNISSNSHNRKILAATAVHKRTGEKLLFVLNRHNDTFYVVGYSSELKAYWEIVEQYSEVTPIYEGEKVTLEF